MQNGVNMDKKCIISIILICLIITSGLILVDNVERGEIQGEYKILAVLDNTGISHTFEINLVDGGESIYPDVYNTYHDYNTIEGMNIALEVANDRTTVCIVSNYDVYIDLDPNNEYSGIIGPSGTLSYATLLISMIEDKEICQSTVMTGTLNVDGDVKEVGSIYQKITGAEESGYERIIIPEDNNFDVYQDIFEDIEVIGVDNIDEVIDLVLK